MLSLVASGDWCILFFTVFFCRSNPCFSLYMCNRTIFWGLWFYPERGILSLRFFELCIAQCAR